MARTTRIAGDRALMARMFVTGLLLVLLYAAFATTLFYLFRSVALMVAIAAGLLFCQYWFSDRIVLWGIRGHLVTEKEAPALHGAIDRLCALANMPKPKVAIADIDMPNAFATGRSPKTAVVCATSGLLRRLDAPELEAVLAHEISHVAHRDVAVMTVASSLGVLAGLLTRAMLYLGVFSGGRRSSSTVGQLVAVQLVIMAVSAVVYAVSFLLVRALSRYRELAADRSGALLVGRPSVLAAALVKITGEVGRIPSRDLRKAEPFNAFFFTPAVTQGRASWRGLLSTHPTLAQRLDQLGRLEAELSRSPKSMASLTS